MKIIQVPFCFYPDAVGGTEVYVANLARTLASEHDCEVLIAAPGVKSEAYIYEGLRVQRFATSPRVNDVSELYGEGDELAAAEFEKILQQQQPDLVHLHALTRGVSLKVLRAAKTRRIPVLFTYHTPTVTCTRGTMMRWGRIPCDGEMLGRRCTACTVHGLLSSRGEDRRWKLGDRTRRLAAQALSIVGSVLPFSISHLPASVSTALRLRQLVETRHSATRAFLSEVDHIVAVCNWVRDVLLMNGVPAEKITLCRQGIAISEEQRAMSQEQFAIRDSAFAFTAERPLRLAFFGRLDPTKGVHVIIEAIRALPSAPITLDIFGSEQGETGAAYAGKVRQIANSDQRVRLRASVPSAKIVSTMREYDAVVVPSQWMETGPLVVLEAFAAGVPVLGSNLGGIAELIQNHIDGFLVNGGQGGDWYSALRQLTINPQFLTSYRHNLPTPRSMREVSREMLQLYESVVQASAVLHHAHI